MLDNCLLKIASLLFLLHTASAHAEAPLVGKPVIDDAFVKMNYEHRSWYPPGEIPFDPIEVAENLPMPSKMAQARILGVSYDDAVRSLAVKLWMIDNSRYTIDMVYYIFERDAVGYAVLGSLCNAVKRGVDVRLMIDSLGSVHMTHKELHALQSCESEAGFVLDRHGNATEIRARVQVVIVNALSKVFVHINRRAHDKLIIVDGHDREHAMLMTGGRNISLAYYGFKEDGTRDPTTFLDMELLLKPSEGISEDKSSIGDISTYYYTLLFLNAENKYLKNGSLKRRDRKELARMRSSLAMVKNVEKLKAYLSVMPEYLAGGYHLSKVRLAHELGNLDNANVITETDANISSNKNSIQSILERHGSASVPKMFRIVSPYFFVSHYLTEDGEDSFDSSENILKLLRENPDSSIEMITNSTLTSENFLVQGVVDMDTAPRLLLSPVQMSEWKTMKAKDERDSVLVKSEEWNEMIQQGRLRIYQTGKLDAVEFGGNAEYAKLHAKFIIADDFGFIGTNNFDYRSRLFNNEFGYFIESEAINAQLNSEFDRLKQQSYQWGSPEWLEMRKQLMARKGMRARAVNMQRSLYKLSKRLGLIWLY